MQIGIWGDIVFEVNAEKVRTPDGMMQQTTARWAVHEPINASTKAEFLGAGQGMIEFTLRLAASLGIDVREEKEKLERLELEGFHAPLMIAMQPVSEKDWYIASAETTYTWIGANGEYEMVSILVQMREY